MAYLVDIQVFIWVIISPNKIRHTARTVLESGTVWISQLSLFEISIKQKIGKLPELPLSIDALLHQLNEDGFQLLPIRNTHIAAYNSIPSLAGHRDPFDRLLVATALVEDFTLISADAHFGGYRPQISLLEA